VKWLAAAALLTLAACKGPENTGPYQPPAQGALQTAEAERLTKEAAELVLSDPEKAESMLREALTKDLFFGPAHNNLGVIHLKRGELYEAAEEFEWARKLMPGHPDPRVNLALTLEKAGRTDEAIASYTAALEVYPDYLPAVQGAALAAVRSGRKDERLGGWLDAIAMRAESEQWREWARQERLGLVR
jgi:tetratricopeptide (TPR) repeat protein